MNRRKKTVRLICITSLLALLGVLVICQASPDFRSERILDTRSIRGADVTETESRSIMGGLSKSERSYAIENGDTVIFGRAQAKRQKIAYRILRTDLIPCDQATVWYCDLETKQWVSAEISEKTIRTTCLYIDGDGADYYAYLPTGYTPLKNNALNLTGSKGYAVIKKCGGGGKSVCTPPISHGLM